MDYEAFAALITLPVLLFLVLWEIVFKGIALWRSARLGNKVWFVAILLLNTLGILPIIYILTHKKSE